MISEQDVSIEVTNNERWAMKIEQGQARNQDLFSRGAAILRFLKYGHKCEIPDEMDSVHEYYSGGCWTKFQKYMFYLRTIMDSSKYYAFHLRSNAAILRERSRHLLYYNATIHPYSYFRFLWEAFITAVMFIQFFLLPLDPAFYARSQVTFINSPLYNWSVATLDIFLCLDVLMNFFTGYYCEKRKEIVLELKSIRWNYLKGQFFVDLLSSFPIYFFGNWVISETHEWVWKFVRLIKLLRLISFVKYVQYLCRYFNISYCFGRAVLAIVLVKVYWHNLVCYYLLVSYIDDKNNTLLPHLERRRFPEASIYIDGLYKASFLMYTSWYSKQQMGGVLRQIYTNYAWFISKAIQFFMLARTLTLLRGVSSSYQKYAQMERQLEDYMSEKQLPLYMRSRLLLYYDFRFHRNYFRESEIFSTLSGQLRQEIILHACRKLVENVGFFKNLPSNLLIRVVSCLRSEIYLMNDVIIRAHTQGDCMYFIATGTVAVYSPSGKEVCHLEDGDYFGEIALVSKTEKRVASVIAVAPCELYRFDAGDFSKAIHPYPDLLENIERIAHERMERTVMLDEHYRREMADKRHLA